MISSVPAVDTCVITGATFTTCGSLARISATLIGIGLPVSPAMKDDPGGSTITSAPIPAARDCWSCSMPMHKPTISRISVTSSATATMLIIDRTGRCTRFPTIIRFIMPALRLLALAIRRLRCRCRRRGALPQMPHLRALRLFQCELVVGQRFIDFQLHHVQGNVVILSRAFNPDGAWEADARPIFVVLVTRVGLDVALLVVNPLPVRQQVRAAELNPPRQIPPLRPFAQDGQLVIRLLHAMLLRVEHGFVPVLQKGNFHVVRSHCRDQ